VSEPPACGPVLGCVLALVELLLLALLHAAAVRASRMADPRDRIFVSSFARRAEPHGIHLLDIKAPHGKYVTRNESNV